MFWPDSMRMSAPFSSIAHASDVGLFREHNEDSLRVNEGAGLLVVADGMGGHEAGEVASRITVDTVEAEVVGKGRSLADAIFTANEAVLLAARDGRGAPGMGTTCVACRLHGHHLEAVWVGDSRGYLYRGGELRPLTRDHSYVQTLVDAGLLEESEVASHPERHVLAQCVGSESLENGDVEINTVAIESGDRVVLCSDGLTGELDDDRIAELLASHAADASAVKELVNEALVSGGRDNVTVVVATIA